MLYDRTGKCVLNKQPKSKKYKCITVIDYRSTFMLVFKSGTKRIFDTSFLEVYKQNLSTYKVKFKFASNDINPLSLRNIKFLSDGWYEIRNIKKVYMLNTATSTWVDLIHPQIPDISTGVDISSDGLNVDISTSSIEVNITILPAEDHSSCSTEGTTLEASKQIEAPNFDKNDKSCKIIDSKSNFYLP